MYRVSKTVDVVAGRARLLKIRHRIIRTSMGDPGIAEPVVVCENQLYIRGLIPGETSLTVWDDEGERTTIDIRVQHASGVLGTAAQDLGDFFAHRVFHLKKYGQFPRQITLSLPLTEVALAKEPAAYLEKIESPLKSEPGQVRRKTEKSKPVSGSRTGPDSGSKKFREDILTVPGGATVKIIECSDKRSFKRSLTLKASQARVLRTDKRWSRYDYRDPEISEAVIVSANEAVILGKSPGRTTHTFYSDQGDVETVEIRVGEQGHGVRSFFRRLAEARDRSKESASIPYADVETLEFKEITPDEIVNIDSDRPRAFQIEDAIARTVVSDPNIVEIVLPSAGEFVFVGKRAGITSAFIWDDKGRVSAFELRVSKHKGKASGSSQAKNRPDEGALGEQGWEIESWTGCKKDVYTTPLYKQQSESTEGSEDEITDDLFQVLPDLDRKNSDSSQTRRACIELNNAGVAALVEDKFALAIRNLRQAIILDPSYLKARTNLAIAFNNLGLQQQHDPLKAIRSFHSSLYLAPYMETSKKNVLGIVRVAGMDPDSFEDRIALAEKAIRDGDLIGASIEYSAALELKNDSRIQRKLNGVNRKIERMKAQFTAKPEESHPRVWR
ncbi:MAG: pilus assembly protein N-terminal domain-containing protein [Candidatus Obscuribacterales bacterium]